MKYKFTTNVAFYHGAWIQVGAYAGDTVEELKRAIADVELASKLVLSYDNLSNKNLIRGQGCFELSAIV